MLGGLGFISNLLPSGGPSKAEAKEAAEKSGASQQVRDDAQRTVDERKQAYADETGGDIEAGKENKEANSDENSGMLTRDQFIAQEKRWEWRKRQLEQTDEQVDGHNRYIVRRWAVRLWNIQVENLGHDSAMVFVNINWGGEREESRIKTGHGEKWWEFLSESEVVYGMGSDPECLRTDVMELREKGKVQFSNEFKFEWRGSYADLENQFMSIELWRWNRFKANAVDCVHKATLVSYATGPVFQEVPLTRAAVTKQDGSFTVSSDNDAPRYRVTFQLYFQELYDFELSIVDVQAFGLISERQLQAADPSEFAKFSKTSAGAADESTGQSIFDPSEDEEDDDDAAAAAAQAMASAGKRWRRGGIISKQNSSIGSVTSPKRAPVVAPRRGKSVAVSKQAQSTKLKRKVVVAVHNQSFSQLIRRGPLGTRSDFHKVEPFSHTSIDRWGNLGKIHYRGTLADLDNDSLLVQFFESGQLSAVPTLIAQASVSLRGVYEFGSMSGACSVPPWLVEAARRRFSPADAKQIMKAAIGRFEAKIAVENTPRYKQSGELCDMVGDKAYLLVKVLRVDRLPVPDQRPISQCDSAVQVQFSGNSYETEVKQDTISPQWNQEFYFELKTNSPGEFSPQELSAMHGPVIFDVWLRSDDEGALTAEHCGHVEVVLSELFAEGKPEVKSHMSIRTGEVVEYRTVVLRSRRKLTCLWTPLSVPAGQRSGGTAALSTSSSGVPASSLAPCYLYVDLWLKPFDFPAFSMSAAAGRSLPALAGDTSSSAGLDPLLPAQVRREWDQRADEWNRRVAAVSKIFPISNRQFDFFAQSQNRDTHFLPLFLDVIRPPELIGNHSAIAFWIHSVPHTSMDELKAASRFWSTPDFTLSLGKGDTVAHAILHCSMLRGLVTSTTASAATASPSPSMAPTTIGRPFVCVGTSWDGEPVAWVATMNGDGSVVFWDSVEHQQYLLPNRCVDVDRCRRVVASRRLPAQQISADLVRLELKRRQRLAKQEQLAQRQQSLNKLILTPAGVECSQAILQAPEHLKLMSAQIHPHALIHSTAVVDESQCMRCGQKVPSNLRHGFVCYLTATGGKCARTISSVSEFLCLSCSDTFFPETPPLTELSRKMLAARFQSEPVLPFKTIDVVFGHTNCWLNLQHFCPSTILFDLWNPLYWHPFTTAQTSFRSFSLAAKTFRKAKSKEYLDGIKLRALAKLKKSIEQLRRNGNLPTFFQHDPLLDEHLERGLELGYRAELLVAGSAERARVEFALAAWKLELYSKIPARHRFVGHVFRMCFNDPVEILRIVKSRIDFLRLNQVGTQFVLAIFLGKLPNDVQSVFVYVGYVFPLSEVEAREAAEQRLSGLSGGAPAALADEVIERNKDFVEKMHVFDSDTDLVSQMRAELYNRQTTTDLVNAAVITFKQSNTSRAPLSADGLAQRSSVDFPSGGKFDDREDDEPSERDALIGGGEGGGEGGGGVEETFVSSFANPFANFAIPTAASVMQNVTDAVSNSTRTSTSGGGGGGMLEMVAPASANAASYFNSLFATASPAAPVTSASSASEKPGKAVSQKPVSVKPAKDFSQKRPITTPLSQVSSIAPTEEELREIYKPKVVERVVAKTKYLEHKATGYRIPIPPQDPLKNAAEGGPTTTKVHVNTAQKASNVKKVAPPKDALYDFNMEADARRRDGGNSS